MDYEEYGYDDNDNRDYYRRRNGDVLTFKYDALNRMVEKSVPENPGVDASHTRDVCYRYNNAGLMTATLFDSYPGNASQCAGEGITQNYNVLGHMKYSTINLDSVSRTLTYTHNDNGFRVNVTHPDGQPFSYVPDNLSRLTHSSAGQLRL
ncbi:hypothetical protein [Teredinibacter haidensis]|uniref:hypothetical protein n=1 Tax=Teredinibacter haidensis TaxID=2731755 RepID=UPI0009489E50|nr:hypothetical protein [Teredinibacter haidensis]